MSALPPAEFLLVLRVAMVAVLYLFILQVVLVARRDLRIAVTLPPSSTKLVIGHLIVIDSGPTALVPGSRLDLLTTLSVGRAPTNTIVLDSTFVSGEHARIFYRDRSLWVEDLKSRNGTFVNDRPVVGTVAVSPNDILRIGDVRFKFVADSREPVRSS
jgi:hypothetical protein